MNELGTMGPDEDTLFGDLAALIESARHRAAVAVNSELVLLYWGVGRRIREDVLGGERAEYGAAVVKRLSARLTERYGRGYGQRNLERMVRFAESWPDFRIASTLSTQLTWSHVIELLALGDRVQRDFYAAFAARERWSVRTLRARIDGKLYERTLAAGDAAASDVERELAALRESGTTPAAFAFRDPYVLDFLGLPPKHSESQFEQAILDDMQRFLTELGAGFAFVERQKRIIVDGEDHHLDLLFYHRHLRCLVAIELKTRKLQPGDYGQVMLYLRWLDLHERIPGEEAPIGLILCAEKGPEQTALLGLDDGEIRASRYLTEPLRERMRERLASVARELPQPG